MKYVASAVCRHCGAQTRRILSDESGLACWCPTCDRIEVIAPLLDGASESLDALLRRLLAERKVSQTALAERLGINRVGIARLVTGRREATAEMCDRIAAALGLSELESRQLHMAAARGRGYQF